MYPYVQKRSRECTTNTNTIVIYILLDALSDNTKSNSPITVHQLFLIQKKSCFQWPHFRMQIKRSMTKHGVGSHKTKGTHSPKWMLKKHSLFSSDSNPQKCAGKTTTDCEIQPSKQRAFQRNKNIQN